MHHRLYKHMTCHHSRHQNRAERVSKEVCRAAANHVRTMAWVSSTAARRDGAQDKQDLRGSSGMGSRGAV